MVFLCSETKILIYKKVLDLISSNTFKNNTSGFLLAVSRDTLQSICMTWLELLSLQPRLIFPPPMRARYPTEYLNVLDTLPCSKCSTAFTCRHTVLSVHYTIITVFFYGLKKFGKVKRNKQYVRSSVEPMFIVCEEFCS